MQKAINFLVHKRNMSQAFEVVSAHKDYNLVAGPSDMFELLTSKRGEFSRENKNFQ